MRLEHDAYASFVTLMANIFKITSWPLCVERWLCQGNAIHNHAVSVFTHFGHSFNFRFLDPGQWSEMQKKNIFCLTFWRTKFKYLKDQNARKTNTAKREYFSKNVQGNFCQCRDMKVSSR